MHDGDNVEKGSAVLIRGGAWHGMASKQGIVYNTP